MTCQDKLENSSRDDINKHIMATNREQSLVVNALHILESQCIGSELYCEHEKDLGGTPNPDEIRELINRIKGTEEKFIMQDDEGTSDE